MIDFKFDANGLLEQLKPAAESVAKTLGTSSDKLLEVGVHGMRAEGIYAITICVLSIIAAVAFIFVVKWGTIRLENEEFDGTGIFQCIVGGLGFIISIMTFATSLHDAVVFTMAPQYALLLKISELLR